MKRHEIEEAERIERAERTAADKKSDTKNDAAKEVEQQKNEADEHNKKEAEKVEKGFAKDPSDLPSPDAPPGTVLSNTDGNPMGNPVA